MSVPTVEEIGAPVSLRNCDSAKRVRRQRPMILDGRCGRTNRDPSIEEARCEVHPFHLKRLWIVALAELDADAVLAVVVERPEVLPAVQPTAFSTSAMPRLIAFASSATRLNITRPSRIRGTSLLRT